MSKMEEASARNKTIKEENIPDTKDSLTDYFECRTCLTKVLNTNPRTNIYEPWLVPFSDTSTIAKELAKLANIQVTQTENHPDVICSLCLTKLEFACQFVETVRTSDVILNSRQSSVVINIDSNKIWPKPIELDKNINGTVFENTMGVEVKQEILSDDDEFNDNAIEDADVPDLAMDIKIEPEEITQPTPPQVCVNGVVSSSKLNQLKENGINSYTNEEYLDGTMKEEPMSEDDEAPVDVPLDCMLCAKIFYSVSGLKAHVIAQHSYKSVKRKMGSIPSPVKKRPNYYTCATCHRKFLTSTDLIVHETCHNKYVCYVCNGKYDTFQLLSKHRQTCDVISNIETPKLKTLEDAIRPTLVITPLPVNETPVKNDVTPNKIKTNGTLKCTLCTEEFSDSYYMKIHHEIHHTIEQSDEKSENNTHTENEGAEVDTNCENMETNTVTKPDKSQINESITQSNVAKVDEVGDLKEIGTIHDSEQLKNNDSDAVKTVITPVELLECANNDSDQNCKQDSVKMESDLSDCKEDSVKMESDLSDCKEDLESELSDKVDTSVQ